MIRYYNRQTSYTLNHKRKYNDWLKSVIKAEAVQCTYSLEKGLRIGELAIVFCSDDYLLSVNKEFLSHDYYTDIITFDYCTPGIISGDLFISIDTVRYNAITYGTTFDKELARVIVHGLLHLLGYNDHSDLEQKIMRNKEDQYLELL